MLAWRGDPRTGAVALILGIVAATGLIALLDLLASIPNPGLVYLPLVAMLAYHWGWRHAAIAGALAVACVYVFFVSPVGLIKPLGRQPLAELLTLAAVTAFVLALVGLARARRGEVEREAERISALNRVGAALAGELDERRLLDLIARTACDLTGAEFAAFTLRPVNDVGQPAVPSEGNLFHLAAIVGVSPAQEALFRRMPLGGEGLLAPIFRHGMPVRVGDALAMVIAQGQPAHGDLMPGGDEKVSQPSPREEARQLARDYAHGDASATSLRSLGVPRGHPVVRSFLGAPLLDREGHVRGGLLLGHSRPDRFTADDEALLVGLAAQAATALENARLYNAAQSRARELDTIFQSIGDGVSLVDAQGRVRRENPAARALRTDLERDGKQTDEIEQLLRTIAIQAGAGEPQQNAQISTGADGARREYLISASPLKSESPTVARNVAGGAADPDGPESGAVVVWRDVTEARRLQAERLARAEAEARRNLLQSIIDELPSGVYLVRGADARLVLANRAAQQVWGAAWTAGMPMAQFLAESGTRMFQPDGRPITLDELATIRALRTRADVRHHQEVIRHHDGRALPVLLNAVAIASSVLGPPVAPDGDAVDAEPAAIVVLQDVTALKEAERLKDDFVGIAAHELRTPLAAVKGYAEMLIKQTARGRGVPLEDWQQEAIESIDQAATRLSDLTDDLLDVTRLQAGRLDLRLEPGDLVALVNRVVRRMQATAEHHILKVHAEADFVVVAMDPHRMEQVLANIIGNAIKYSPNGGDVDITIGEHATEGVAQLDVRDSGIGIPADQQVRLFNRFARADNAAALGIKGTGLGLYICRELVERHGGRIWFDSAENAGTTIHIALPLVAGEEDDAGAASQA